MSDLNNSKIEFSLIKCIYDIKDNNITHQIINNRGEKTVNEEIESKIKILNGNQKEKLIFQKKFDKMGMNEITFIVEEKLNNMSFMFNDCSSLKEIYFINFETIKATSMSAMFQKCNEIENLDLSNFNTSNVTDMKVMFSRCHKSKFSISLHSLNIPLISVT